VISRLRGQVLEVTLDHLVLKVGGVGLTVHTTPAVLAQLSSGHQADLATVLLVRADSLTLYGFTDPASRELFVLLQTVAGIGPRVALATLAVLSPTDLRHALATGDTTMLTRVPGIGRKGAERMIVELGDRVTPTTAAAGAAHIGPAGAAAPGADPAGAAAGSPDRGRAQVVDALIGLGFAARQADQAVTAVTAVTGGDEHPDGAGPAGIDPGRTLRAALNHLGPRR